jgi:4-oxalocrotonate tautomerase
MPHIIVKLWPGKSRQQKQQLADEITRSVTSVLGYGDESVSVGFEEVSAGDGWSRSTSPTSSPSRTACIKNPATARWGSAHEAFCRHPVRAAGCRIRLRTAQAADAPDMIIARAGSQASGKGPAQYFTGSARVDPLFPAACAIRHFGRLRHLRTGRALGLAHAPGRPGIDRHRRRRDACSAGAARSRRSVPATWSGPRPASSTGTAPRPPPR